MNWSRRDFLKASLLLPAGVYLAKFQALAAPHAGKVKITAIKTLELDNVGDGCLIRIETDAGLVGYGESGVSAKMARARIENIQEALLGQDPLAIGRHFHLMTDQQHPFMGNIPSISGIDIALWDLAGKILDEPIYRLLGGPMRPAAPIYAHGGPRNILDLGECRAWAQQVREAPEGFTAFKFDIGSAGVWLSNAVCRDPRRVGFQKIGHGLPKPPHRHGRRYRYCHALSQSTRYAQCDWSVPRPLSRSIRCGLRTR